MNMYNEQYDSELKDIFEQHKLTVGMIVKSKKKKYLYDYVLKMTESLKNLNLTTRIFYVINHQTEPVKCLTCGKILKNGNIKFRDSNDFRGAFRRFCCPHCECIHPDVKNKLHLTNLKKYGCEWTFQSENNVLKSKETMLKKYGCEFAQQNKNIKAKSYQSMIEKYDVKHPMQSNKIRQKSIFTRRCTEYEKFTNNKYVIPLFSCEEFKQFGNEHIYDWKCLKCGNEFKSFKNETWFKEGAVKSYARCEKCFPINHISSLKEKEVKQFIESYSISCVSNDRSLISPYEIDIYISNKKLAIEFDGLFWHSENSGTPSTYHLMKTEACEKQGIQLIHIFENEWIMKQDIVKSRLKNLLGIYDNVVFARKCEVKEVDSKTSNEFQDNNHIQGAVNAKVNLGLFFNNELISLMTFSKPRFSKKYEWELLRFCNKLGYHIPGGASRLLKYFERNYHPTSMISYADRRWSQGKLYQTLGFTLDHISKPDYWYIRNTNNLNLMHRSRFQKHKLKNVLQNFDESLSEVENMKNNGFLRIFDCGNLVFVKKVV